MNYLDIRLQGIDHLGHEKEYELSGFKGQRVVLYFYPKDNTPGCTKEACDFRDNFNRLIGKATVIGVSADSISSHKKFREDQDINFILLSDPERKLAKALHVEGRTTFVLNEDGKVDHEWRNVQVEGHVDGVIAVL